MVNILDITNEDGETLQINQMEVNTPEGRERIERHMGLTSKRVDAVFSQSEDARKTGTSREEF
jgi:hypothetical protein